MKTKMVRGYCHRCGKYLEMVPYYGADWIFCRKCVKAEDVYTPPYKKCCSGVNG